MTEDEAKTKWCPMSRVVSGDKEAGVVSAVAFNRTMNVGTVPVEIGYPKGACCIGSGCMMWRWGKPSMGPGYPDHGYCGLASAR